MRPTYQTAQNELEEQQTLEAYGLQQNMVVTPTPTHCCFDGIAYKPVHYVEVKCRKYPKNAFRTYDISKRKVDELLKLDMPVVLVVKWTDGITYTTLREGYETGPIGRAVVRDEWDREEGYKIPMTEMREL